MKFEGISDPREFRRIPGRGGRLLDAVLRFPPAYKLANLLTAVRFVVHGDSMQPALDEDQYIMVSRMAYRWQGPSRGDVVVMRHPDRWNRNYIKRVVGLPGERVQVQDEAVYINGRALLEPYLNGSVDRGHSCGAGDPFDNDGLLATLGPESDPARDWLLEDDQYFVMGDNRADSDDSRGLGPVGRDLIVGKAWIRYWPRNVWGIIKT